MFTGLVRCLGEIHGVRPGDERSIFTLEGELSPGDLLRGASVAVDGVCLTVTAADGGRFEVEAAFETLRCTTLGQRVIGDHVNLEPALRMGDPLGGHLVTGHVDGVGRVRASKARGAARELCFDAAPPVMRFVARKGSITIQGVSLTVNDLDATGFMVGIIPHTLAVTNLGELSVGDEVNLEVDIIARYVERLTATSEVRSTGLSVEALTAAGFIAQGDHHGSK